ncbi:MAG: ABC transporter ATP-binding protein [Gammaproteobacteria bacterium]|nr:ABC transporter ATP-binding protein [Gammaproteobacteria bacterium]
MSNAAISVENVTKLYRLGSKKESSDSMASAILGFVKSPINNFKKYRGLYRFDDVLNGDGTYTSQEDVLCAINNVSFECMHGESVAIVGANGAGKSTLLKILSRVTSPTFGQIKIRGRISSLLEVGTGFNQELTGRENVYLNGIVLGMSKVEVDRKFDEIIEFSGVERFLDTPVKRYSSGMKVRLAFAVAAHLDPDILIVDEVLAVGDAAFQEKCLGKMKDVTGSGRTVLFVSHNMAAVTGLCERGILLEQGQIVKTGTSQEVADDYISSLTASEDVSLDKMTKRSGDQEIIATNIQVLDKDGVEIVSPCSGQEVTFRLHYSCNDSKVHKNCKFSIFIHRQGHIYIDLNTYLVHQSPVDVSGSGYVDMVINELPLKGSSYTLGSFIESNREIKDHVFSAKSLSVLDGDFYGTGRLLNDNCPLVKFNAHFHSNA